MVVASSPTSKALRQLAVVLLMTALACGGPMPLTHEKARGMIEATAAFQEPLDEDLRRLDPRYADPNLKREMLKVEALTSKADGPLGMAGETATVTFTWRFNQGSLAAVTYRSRAKIHGDAQGWKVYEDKLQASLRASMGGGDE